MPLLAVADPVIAVGVVSVLSFAATRLCAWRAAKESPKTGMRRIRIAYSIGGFVTGLVALFAVVLADALDLTESALRAASPVIADSPVGAVLTWVPTILGVTVAVEASYLGAFPYVRDLRDLDASAAAAWSLGKFLGLCAVMIIVVVGTTTFAPAGTFASALPVLALLVVFGIVVLGLQPWIIAMLNDVRNPTDAERDLITRLCETAGVSANEIRIVDFDANRLATVVFAGLPGHRYLLVTTDLLADLDDSMAAAVVSSKTGRTRLYYREVKVAVLLTVGGIALGLASGELQALTGLSTGVLGTGTIALTVVLSWLGKRIIYAADDYAVERVGVETFVRTLETLADDQQISYEWSRLRGVLLMQPSLGDRLDRLWGRIEE